MNLAVLSWGLPRHGSKRGGVDRVAHDLADGLSRRGHRVTVWSFDPKPPGASYQVRSLPWCRLTERPLGRRITWGYLGNLIALLPDYRACDAIISHGDSLLLPLARKPFLRVMHGSGLGEALSASSRLRKISQLGVYLQELWCGLAQAGCIAVSRNTIRHNPFIRRIIPNGVDLDAFHADPRAKTAQPSILFVGALDGRKRGRMLLQAFETRVRPRFPSATLDMVCPSGEASPGVTYHQGIDTFELAALYRRAWLYASTSAYEGFGLPYVEAMASGTPVLATPNPGSREVLDCGQYGRLATDDRFGEVLVELLADERERSRLTERGLERARVYGLERMVTRYEQALQQLLE